MADYLNSFTINMLAMLDDDSVFRDLGRGCLRTVVGIAIASGLAYLAIKLWL
jgi:hypothetical protein